MSSKFDNSRVKGFLHAQGTKIVNGDGEEIILAGYGAGNWTNPEGFMVGAPTSYRLIGDIFSPRTISPHRFDRRRTFDQVLRETCGTKYAAEFWPKWQRNHLAEIDIRTMAELGLNSVRLPINAAALLEEEPGLCWIEDGFRMLDDVLDWCETYRIYAILDLHAAPGGQSATCCDGGYDNYPHLFADDESWGRALAIWDRLSARYADRWIVGGYDLLNEPVSLPNHHDFVPKLARFYDEAIAVIRKNDKKHMFTLEGSCFSRSNQIFDHDFDPLCHNWCIHVHMYGFSPELRELYPYLLKARELNVPVWIGEGGSDEITNAAFYNIAADYGIGFNLWCWKTARETSNDDGHHAYNAVQYTLPKDWERIRTFCAGGPKPSYEASQKIFDELLEAIKYENCRHNKDFIRVTLRKPEQEIPAAAYDNLTPDGSRYMGRWDFSNLLNFRVEDHTKLVWMPGLEEPRPGFDMYPDEHVQPPFNPLTSLLLELQPGEDAYYSIRFVTAPTAVTVEGRGLPEGAVQLYDGEMLLGEAPLGEALGVSQPLCILPPREEYKLRIVANGPVQLKSIRFHNA